MSLLVWLPLNKENDFLNKGLAQVSVTNSNAVYDSAGKLGGCYSFTGSNYILTTYPSSKFDANLRYSTSAWVYFTSFNGGYNPIIGAGSNYHHTFYVTSAGRLGFVCWDSTGNHANTLVGIISDSTIPLNTWTHVAFTFDGTYIKGYINGVEQSHKLTYTSASKDADKKINLRIGGGIYTWGVAYSKCKISDVRIYNNCLSASEVKKLSQGLVAHYPLCDPYNGGCTISLLNGKSLVWNLMCTGVTPASTAIWTITLSNNIYTLTGVSNTSKYCSTKIGGNSIMNHKYYIGINVLTNTLDLKMCINPNPNNDGTSVLFIAAGQTGYLSTVVTKTWWHTPTSGTGVNYWVILSYTTNPLGTMTFNQPTIVDLTLMFGSGNEPTAELFEAMFPNDYYSYNAGSFLNYGAREYEWNLLVSSITYSSIEGLTITLTGDRSYNIQGTTTETWTYAVKSPLTINGTNIPANHKSYIRLKIDGIYNDNIYFRMYTPWNSQLLPLNSTILETSSSGNIVIYTYCIKKGITVNFNLSIDIIDLTQLFGSGNEPTSVEEFESWLELNNITDFSYNTGEKKYLNYQVGYTNRGNNLFNKYTMTPDSYILYTDGVVHSDTRFNASDWIQVVPGKTYYHSVTNEWGAIYDKDKNYILQSNYGTNTMTMPYNAKYIRFTVTKGTENSRIFTINDLFTKTLEYSAPLTIDFSSLIHLYLPNGVCSVGTIKDTIVFNENNIVITLNTKDEDLSNSSWTLRNSDTHTFYTTTSGYVGDAYKTGTDSSVYQALCTRYSFYGPVTAGDTFSSSAPDKSFALYLTGSLQCLYIKDSAYSDAASLKTSLKGILMKIALATPVVTTITTPMNTSFYNCIQENGYDTAEGLSISGDYTFLDGVRNTIVYDISGFNHDLSSMGQINTSSNTPRHKKSTYFNGNKSYAQMDYPNILKPDMITISLWVNPSSIPTSVSAALFNCWESGGGGLCIATNGKPYFEFYISGVGYKGLYSTTGLNVGQWYHLVGTYDKSDFKIYVNGILENTLSVTGTISYNTTAPWTIAMNPAADGSYGGNIFNGYMSDARLYSTALSADDVAELYKYGPNN